eukprot:scaffold183_cov249-Pinguiococcus_pyrenoidosus.AAC.2
MQDTVVFAIGVVPFAWATVEFWRRIAVGLGFGTGKDSIVIDPDTDYSGKEGRCLLCACCRGSPRQARDTLAHGDAIPFASRFRGR